MKASGDGMCVCVWQNSLTTRFDLTADASLFPLSADPADQNVERVGEDGVDLGFYLLEFGGCYVPRLLPDSKVHPTFCLFLSLRADHRSIVAIWREITTRS